MRGDRRAVRAGGRAAASARVAVVGAGAVGCYYGGMLARAGVPVTLIGRPAHVEAMRRDGLRLTSAAFDEHIPVEASTDVAAVAGARAGAGVRQVHRHRRHRAPSSRPHLAPDARVLSLQNGVDNAPRLQAVLGRPVAPAVVYVASEMAGPGHVRHLGRGELVIPADIGHGARPRGSADIVALFARAGVPVELSDNVVGALWGKLLLNCGYNAISAITDLPYGRMVTLPGIARTVHDAVGRMPGRRRGAGRRDPRRRLGRGRPHRHARCPARCRPPARTCAAASPPRSTT